MYAPSDQDIALLRQAARDCGLHERTLTFTHDPFEYAITIDRSFGDTEERIDCALDRLPRDFMGKFGLGPLIVTIPAEKP